MVTTAKACRAQQCVQLLGLVDAVFVVSRRARQFWRLCHSEITRPATDAKC